MSGYTLCILEVGEIVFDEVGCGLYLRCYKMEIYVLGCGGIF